MSTITVPQIATAYANILKTNPLTLEVIAVAFLPTSGFQNQRLALTEYVTPPADGIYEISFQIDEPLGPVPDKLTPYAAVDYWDNFPQATLKGVRILGIKESKTIMI